QGVVLHLDSLARHGWSDLRTPALAGSSGIRVLRSESRDRRSVFGRGVHIFQSARIGLIHELDVGVDEELARAVLAAACVGEQSLAGARLENSAQRLGQPVVAGAIGGSLTLRLPGPDEMRDRRLIHVRQIAGEHQPGGPRITGLSGKYSRDGTESGLLVHDLGKSGANGIIDL